MSPSGLAESRQVPLPPANWRSYRWASLIGIALALPTLTNANIQAIDMATMNFREKGASAAWQGRVF